KENGTVANSGRLHSDTKFPLAYRFANVLDPGRLLMISVFFSIRSMRRPTKKLSRAAGWVPASAARGMATTFYCGSFAGGKPKNCSKRSVTSSQAARRVENRHAGTGEGISYTVWDLFRRWSGRRRLWHPWSA